MIDRSNGVYRNARRAAILVVGSLVTLAGVALLVLPGPAFIVIPAGLAILALEFEFARRWLKQLKEWIRAGAAKAREKLGKRGGDSPD